jgi:LacI family transcriptional regulator
MSKPTIQDVAQKAGVGVGTVSRVLNNHPSVRDSTREKILKAMESLSYTPNPHARRIAGGRSYTVSVMLPMVAAEFYIRLLTSIEETLGEQRYDAAIFPMLGRERLERYLESHTMPYQADGIIQITYNLAVLFPDGRMPTEQPVVLVDGKTDLYDCTYVDNYHGGLVAAEYTCQTEGEIYLVSFDDENDPDAIFKSLVFADRIHGFQEGVSRAGRSIKATYFCGLQYHEGLAITKQIFDHAQFPITIFAGADILGRPMIDEAKARGLILGQDVRIIGFDNQPWAAEIGLTTLHQPVEEMGAKAAMLLLERLSGFEGPPRQFCYQPFLIERASSMRSVTVV